MKRQEVVNCFQNETPVTINIQEVHRLRAKFGLMQADFGGCESVPLTITDPSLQEDGYCRVSGGTVKAKGTIWNSNEFMVPIQAVDLYRGYIPQETESNQDAEGKQLSLFG